jgi:hypothetical protein
MYEDEIFLERGLLMNITSVAGIASNQPEKLRSSPTPYSTSVYLHGGQVRDEVFPFGRFSYGL